MEFEGRAVYSDWLWIPKGLLHEPSIRASLTFLQKGYKSDTKIRGWKETSDHILVPREFFSRDKLVSMRIERDDQIPEFEQVELEDKVTLDLLSGRAKTTQRDAYAKLTSADNGVLQLGCGHGKTVIALKHICDRGVPALVIVETKDLLEQWKESIDTFVEMGAAPGVVQGSPEKWVWKRSISVAMIQSLAKYHEEVPEPMRRWFGTIVYDEAHHLSSRFFVRAAPMFYGKRIGLTATPRREDGLEGLYYAHIGQPFHKDIEQPLTPKAIVYTLDLPVDWNANLTLEEITDTSGDLSFPKLWGFIGRQRAFQMKVLGILTRMINNGRKVLVLSHRVDTLVRLNEALSKTQPGQVGLVIGSVDPEERRRRLKSCSIVLGTMQLAKEGLDEKRLDTLLVLEPFAAEGVLQQAAGRILRTYQGKQRPVVGIIRVNYSPCYALAAKLKRHFKKWPTKVELVEMTI